MSHQMAPLDIDREAARRQRVSARLASEVGEELLAFIERWGGGR